MFLSFFLFFFEGGEGCVSLFLFEIETRTRRTNQKQSQKQKQKKAKTKSKDKNKTTENMNPKRCCFENLNFPLSSERHGEIQYNSQRRIVPQSCASLPLLFM